MRRTAAVAAAVLGLTLSACGEDEPVADDVATPSATPTPTPTPTPSDEPTPTAEPTPTEDPGTTLTVTISGGQAEPNAEEVEVERGEPVTLEIVSDRAGEIHVHGRPDTYVDFTAGTTTEELVFDLNGVVEIEDHSTGRVYYLVQVS